MYNYTWSLFFSANPVQFSSINAGAWRSKTEAWSIQEVLVMDFSFSNYKLIAPRFITFWGKMHSRWNKLLTGWSNRKLQVIFFKIKMVNKGLQNLKFCIWKEHSPFYILQIRGNILIYPSLHHKIHIDCILPSVTTGSVMWEPNSQRFLLYNYVYSYIALEWKSLTLRGWMKPK